MGYYDFNDHFWAANQVCGQLSQSVVTTEHKGLIWERLLSLFPIKIGKSKSGEISRAISCQTEEDK